MWQYHDICIPSSKMGEENFSKKSVVAGQKIFDFKEETTDYFFKGRTGNFHRKWNIAYLQHDK